MTDRQTKINRIVAYCVSCGDSIEHATRYAEELLDKNKDDTASLIIRFRDDYGKVDEFCLENFSFEVEFYGWEKIERDEFLKDFVEKAYQQGRINIDRFFGDIEYAKEITQRNIQYVFLDSKDPFYNSIWGQIPADVAEKCCESVRNRIAKGI